MKWIQEHQGTAIICAIVFAIILIVAIWSWPSKKPVNAPAIIDDTKTKLEEQYKKQLKEKTDAEKLANGRLKVEQEKYRVLVDKYSKLQKEKEDVKPPVDDADRRQRFIDAGFVPLPSK
jgi:hypothetical protein